MRPPRDASLGHHSQIGSATFGAWRRCDTCPFYALAHDHDLHQVAAPARQHRHLGNIGAARIDRRLRVDRAPPPPPQRSAGSAPMRSAARWPLHMRVAHDQRRQQRGRRHLRRQLVEAEAASMGASPLVTRPAASGTPDSPSGLRTPAGRRSREQTHQRRDIAHVKTSARAVLGGRRMPYERRRPEYSALHRVVRENLMTLYAATDDGDAGATLPAFVRKELEGYLDCGSLCRGFAVLACTTCHERRLVAFSCKSRGFCPSCLGRRMAQTACNLLDHVLPHVPLRQWVLTLPHELRRPLAYDRELLAKVGRIFVSSVLGFYRRRLGGDEAKGHGMGGAVVVVQRSSSDLKLNPHFHAVFLDGVYRSAARDGPVFAALPRLSTSDVADVLQTVRVRIIRFLVRRGVVEAGPEVCWSEALGLTRFSGQFDCTTNSGSALPSYASIPSNSNFSALGVTRGLKVMRADRSYWAGLS